MEGFTIDGIEIAVIRKPIKNLYIRVLPPEGAVQITAPRFVSTAEIRAFAQSRIPWIQAHRRALADRPRPAERQFCSGEVCWVWGQRCFLEVEERTGRPRAELQGERLLLYVPGGSTREDRESALDGWYRAQLQEAVPEVLARCQERVGVRAAEWRIRKMRTRWGTCNPAKRRIWLSLQLAEKPPECLAYVVTHELVHLLERTHNQRFWSFMDRFYPNWRTVRARLNRENGQDA